VQNWYLYHQAEFGGAGTSPPLRGSVTQCPHRRNYTLMHIYALKVQKIRTSISTKPRLVGLELCRSPPWGGGDGQKHRKTFSSPTRESFKFLSITLLSGAVCGREIWLSNIWTKKQFWIGIVRLCQRAAVGGATTECWS